MDRNKRRARVVQWNVSGDRMTPQAQTYEEFREQWMKQHPASVPAEPKPVLPHPRWLPAAVMLMFIGAVVLSAVHTIPTMYDAIPVNDVISDLTRRLAAHASVIVVELSLFVSVYASAGHRSWSYYVIQAVAFVGALAANLYSVSHSFLAGNAGGTVTGVIIGTLPPLVALLSGEVFVRMHQANAKAIQEAITRYQEAMKVLDAVINSAFSKAIKQTSAKVSERTDNGRTSHAAFGHTRTPDGLQKAIDWFTDNPDKVNWSLRDLEAPTGLGRDTLSRARRQWLAAQQPDMIANGNGHFEAEK